MNLRVVALCEETQRQIDTLSALLSGCDEQTLGRALPARARLGDGTIGASFLHTLENHLRVTVFLREGAAAAAGQLSHHGSHYTAQTATREILSDRLSAARRSVASVRTLSEQQLDEVPPEGTIKLADGKRTVEQIVAGLLKHQAHQVTALRSAILAETADGDNATAGGSDQGTPSLKCQRRSTDGSQSHAYAYAASSQP